MFIFFPTYHVTSTTAVPACTPASELVKCSQVPDVSWEVWGRTSGALPWLASNRFPFLISLCSCQPNFFVLLLVLLLRCFEHAGLATLRTKWKNGGSRRRIKDLRRGLRVWLGAGEMRHVRGAQMSFDKNAVG